MTGCSNPSDWFFLVYVRLTVHGTEGVWAVAELGRRGLLLPQRLDDGNE